MYILILLYNNSYRLCSGEELEVITCGRIVSTLNSDSQLLFGGLFQCTVLVVNVDTLQCLHNIISVSFLDFILFYNLLRAKASKSSQRKKKLKCNSTWKSEIWFARLMITSQLIIWLIVSPPSNSRVEDTFPGLTINHERRCEIVIYLLTPDTWTPLWFKNHPFFLPCMSL